MFNVILYFWNINLILGGMVLILILFYRYEIEGYVIYLRL